MLTLVASLAATFAVDGCGGKSSTKTSTSSTAPLAHKHSSKPSY
ncbi:MAG TPA: hypothetical protein VHT27_07850 [Solirubrobacteraceae bacterium]|nr:hypothetical protein [Solirubrobacteraceae bacterium]